jgi:hypothetical protein
VWTRGIQIGVTTILGKSTRHLPHVTTEEVSERSHRCSTARSDTAQSRFDLSRAPDQDLGSEGSCHLIKILDQKARGCSTVKFLKVQSSNHSEEATWETDDFLHSCHLESKLSWREICYCSLFLLGYFSFSNLVMRFHLTWEDCDSYSVTVAATVLYSAIYGVIYSVSCLSSILNSNLFFEYYLNRVITAACKGTSNFINTSESI